MSLDAAFQLLGLDRGMDDASIDAEAKKAYRKLAQKAHPDKGGSTEEFQRLGEAYERVCSRNESPFSSMGGGMGAGDVEEMLRQMFGGGGGMGGGFADLFGGMGGGFAGMARWHARGFAFGGGAWRRQ